MAHCDEYLELISARLDGALSPEEYARLEAHLAQCPECRALAEDLAALSAELRDLPVMKAPEGLSQRIAKAVAEDKAVPFAPRKKRSHWKQWASCAAVLALVLIGSGGLKDWQAPAVSDRAAPEAAAQQAPVSNEAAPAAQDPAPAALSPEKSVYGRTNTPNVDPVQAAGDEMEGFRQEDASAPAAESGSARPAETAMDTAPKEQEPAPVHAPAMDTAPKEQESGPAETAAVAPGFTRISMAPVLTEADAAAMARLLAELDWAEPTWEDEATALLFSESETVTALTWAGRSGDGRACLFDLTSRVYDPAWAEDARPTQVTPLGRYSVPLDGAAIQFTAADPVSD